MVEFAEVSEVKMFLNIDQEDEELNELLQYLISWYSSKIENRTGITDLTNETQELLFYAIGCHLAKTNPDIALPLTSYEVGNLSEKVEIKQQELGENWCQLYRDALRDLEEEAGYSHPVVGAQRKGLSSQYVIQ